jgi:energy-converting hydrogenase A subunit R
VKGVFVSDCEGPISKNDNAFEITANFVPDGEQLFTVISRYDDVLADVLRRPDYKAGSTLKLVLPFLKAYDVTDQKIREFSAKHLVLISNAKETIRHVRNTAPAFIVSTSYEHYMKIVCQALEFPFENTYSTKINIDKYTITETEKAQLKRVAREIAQMPIFDVPTNARSLKDLSEKAQTAIGRLDTYFWEKIMKMKIGRMYSEVKPVGGTEKAGAIKDIVQKLDLMLTDVMYVGDSITDMEAFALVNTGGGMSVSFNGNQYAVRNAEIAVLSESNLVTAILADVFIKYGREEALGLVQDWNRRALEKSHVREDLLDRFLELYPTELPKVKITTSRNREDLARESSQFRRKVRGEAVGGLG